MRRLAEPLGLSVGGLAILSGYLWLARFGLDLVDEGYFLDLASRLQHGQLPYRDFDTYYTPGLLYLQAGALSLLGQNVESSRVLMVLLRVACVLLVYRLARHVAPPAFAAVSALILALTGVLVGSNPGWPAMLGTLLMLEALAVTEKAGGSGWRLGLVGAAAAIAFAFKQNVGAFALLAAVGYVTLRPRDAGAVVLGLRLTFGLGLAWIVRAFLSPALDELLGATLWLPLVFSLGLLVWWTSAVRPAKSPLLAGVGGVVHDALWLGAGFGGVTLAWLAPLALALGPADTPFGLFLGAVKQGALFFPLDAPPRATGSVALLAVWAPLALAFAFHRARTRLVWPLAVAAQVSLVMAWLPTRAARADSLSAVTRQVPLLESLYLDLGTLYLYLPPLAAWTGLVLLARSARRRSRPPLVAWLLLAGALAELAFYPRSDTPHAVLAGAPLLVVGAWALARIHAALAQGASRVGQASVFVALLVAPAVAVLPHVYGSYFSLLSPAFQAAYQPVRLERASVLELPPDGDALSDAVAFIQARTSPGEPVFTYPVDPLVNFVAERPNPTRFDHLMPGALSADEMRQTVDSLEAAQPRFVFWDHGAVIFWDTDEPNRPLSDYIWRCYNEVAAFHLYLVLERLPDCQTSTSPP